MEPIFTFTSKLYKWEGKSAWHFIDLPVSVTKKIKSIGLQTGGFGSLRVKVGIGRIVFTTSIFPDNKKGTYLLPIKQLVRKSEKLEEGDNVKVILTIII